MFFKMNGEIYQIENFEKFSNEGREEIKVILEISNFTLGSIKNNGVFLERGQIVQAYIDVLEDKSLNVKFIPLGDVFNLEV